MKRDREKAEFVVEHNRDIRTKSPQYFGVALDVGDERNRKYYYQRCRWGFDDTETWNLDIVMCSFMLPRIRRYKEVKDSYPAQLTTEQEWDDILDKIIVGFELVLTDDYFCPSDEQQEVIDEAFELFGKWVLKIGSPKGDL